MKVAVIPARGGSKRIPRKNIKEFHGKPMIAWSIDAAKRAGIFDKIIVSTDDSEVASIAKQYGAEVPFTRPTNLSDDYATTVEVLAHSTEWLSDAYKDLEAVCCIYPTAPFLDPTDIVTGYKTLNSLGWQYAFSVTKFNASVYRAFIENAEGGIEMIFPEHYKSRSQDLPESLHDAAQFYWGKPEAWLSKKPIFGSYSIAVHLPGWRVVDIDNPADFDRALSLAPNVFARMNR